MAPINHAAYLVKPKQLPYVVTEAPYTAPGTNEVTIRTRAVAINPIDIILPDRGNMIYTWLKYPFILGFDVAGEVVEVGPGAESRFTMGDRVVGMAVGTDKSRNHAAEGGFQNYVVLMADMTSPIPAGMSYERASVLPLGLSTAACGLFQDDQLALRPPSAQVREATGQSIVVWGGSTSVGGNAIQLAVAAGYDVFTTASPQQL
ncbi:hypothetical protein LTR17_018082 [Elasticomyces elasticus]|nr:hypothetical protein LTR17_018082 [Elasticomyces elasticus]